MPAWMRNICWLPQRVVLSLMGFAAIINAYTMRVCLNLAITEMTVHFNHSGIIAEGHCPLDESQAISSNQTSSADQQERFEWSEPMQGLILSSFYWGYTLTHLPGGLLAEKYGGKWLLSLGIFSTAIFTLLTPVVVRFGGANALIVLRILEGLGEGTTFPALSAMLAAWIPLNERSMLGSLVFGGGQVGAIFGTWGSGWILNNYSWEVVFYVWGVIGMLWFIFFTILCYSDPDSHPFISEQEKEYLSNELGQLRRGKNLPPVPFRLVLTNAPMISIVIAQIGHDFGFFIMVSDLPKYMKDILHLSVSDNGLYSALPYFLMWVVSVTSGVLSDVLIKRDKITITFARKMFTTIASIFPAILMVLASYSGCDRTLVIICFTLAMGFMGTYYPGMKVNVLDLSPNYAGTLMAVTNGMGAVTGIVAPALVGVMTPNRSLFEWRIVFWIAFVVFNITNLEYCIWASGEVQPFNDPETFKI